MPPNEVLAIGGIGCAVLSYASMMLRPSLRAWRWQKTTGTVAESWIDRNGTALESRLVVGARYRYTVDDRPYKSDRIAFQPPAYRTQQDAERRLKPLTPGATVDVWYDPADPSSAVLQRSIDWTYYLGAAVGLGLVVGTAIVIAALPVG